MKIFFAILILITGATGYAQGTNNFNQWAKTNATFHATLRGIYRTNTITTGVSYTATTNDHVISYTGATNAVLTVPTANRQLGQELKVVNLGTGSLTITGQTDYSLTNQFQSIILTGVGTNLIGW